MKYIPCQNLLRATRNEMLKPGKEDVVQKRRKGKQVVSLNRPNREGLIKRQLNYKT